MKFLNTKTIKECVDADNCLKPWGGNDDYTFKFVPEVKKEVASNGNLNNNNSSNVNNNNYVNIQNNSQSNATNNGDGFNTSHVKKVRTFGFI